MSDIKKIAEILDNAATHATGIEQISAQGYGLDLKQAYQVQRQLVQRRLDRGERIVGIKMGFTSRVKMVQMGVDDLIWGRLTDVMKIDNGGTLVWPQYIHPRVEPEIAFLLKRDIRGKIDMPEAKAAVEGIALALEVIDSRYQNFKFSLEDVVADNSSSSSFIVGDWCQPDIDISDLAMSMKFDGEEVQSGSSSAILGDPWQSLVEAARLAAESNFSLKAGWIVMAGAATAAESLRPGVTVNVSGRSLSAAEFNVSD